MTIYFAISLLFSLTVFTTPKEGHPELNTISVTEINDDVLVVDVHWLDILQNASKNKFTIRESLWYNNTGDDFFDDDVALWVPESAKIKKVAQIFGGLTGDPNEIELTFERDGEFLYTRPRFGIAPFGESGVYEVEIRASSHDSSETASITTTTIIGEKVNRYGLKAEPVVEKMFVSKNSTVEFQLAIENTGNVADDYDLFIERVTDGWEAKLTDNSLKIQPFKTITTVIELTAPEDIFEGSLGTVDIKVISRNDTTRFESVEFKAEIGLPGLPDLLPLGIHYTNTTINSTISNNGKAIANNIQVGLFVDNASIQNITLVQLVADSFENISFNWTYEFNRTVRIFIDPLDNILESNETNNIIENKTGTTWPGNATRSSDDGSRQDRSALSSGTRADDYGTISMTLVLNESVVELGWQVTYSIEIKNEGESPDTLFLTAYNMPEGWIRRFVDVSNHEISSITVDSNSKVDVGFQMVIPWYNLHLFVEYEHEFEVEKFDDGSKNRIMYEKKFIYETGEVDGAFILRSGTVINAGDNFELNSQADRSGDGGGSQNHYFFTLNNVTGNTAITSTIEWEDEDTGPNELLLYLVVFVIIMIAIMLIVKFMLKARGQKISKSQDEIEDEPAEASSDAKKSTNKKRKQ